MKKIFEEMNLGLPGKNLHGLILPFESFTLYRDINNVGFTFENMFPTKNIMQNNSIIQKAEEYLDEPYPVLNASVYLQFKRNGNRKNYEEPYFKRRNMVLYLLLAECIEKKRRFTDKLLDGVWMILEESTWVLPAHNGHKPHSDTFCPLPYCYAERVDYADLFSAETGALMAWVHYLGVDILDNITPVIRERILYELYRRIITPFFNEDQWWTSLKGNAVNNWNPWIVSNMLTVCALCVKDTAEREKFAMNAMTMIDGFTKNYPDDGGCDEGPSYWNVASASYFDCLELLYDISGGNINAFNHPFVNKLCEYIMFFHISDKYYLNFADSPSKLSVDYRSVARMGKLTGSKELNQFGLSLDSDTLQLSNNRTYRAIKRLFDQYKGIIDEMNIPDKAFESLGVMVMRNDKKSFIGIKGGHNAEGHNHNDVGNFVVFMNNEPLFIDVGVGTYTADTFNQNRYKIWTMRSCYHNLPDINGKEQFPSGKAKASDSIFDTENRMFKTELKNAYPEDTSLLSFIRQANLLDDDCITVTDSIKLNSKGNIAFHLMAKELPDLRSNGKMIFKNATVLYDDRLSIEIDSIELSDKQLINTWNTDVLYRICLSVDNVEEFTSDIKILRH